MAPVRTTAGAILVCTAVMSSTPLFPPKPRRIPPPAAIRKELRQALLRELRGEVQFDDAVRALYATDASVYRQLPIGVLLPRDEHDVQAAIAVCNRYEAAILPRGGGTSLAGQCCNAAVILDFSRHMQAILDIDAKRRVARVQPGVILDDLLRAAAPHGLTFAPDPSTHSRCTLGGMIGNNSCGIHSMMGGKTSENVEELVAVTGDGVRLTLGGVPEAEVAAFRARPGREGEIYRSLDHLRQQYGGLVRERFPQMPRLVSGYALDQLLPEHGFHVARALVGSEGTCVTLLEATVRLVASPPARVLLVLGYDEIEQAADAVPELLQAHPIGLEGIDERLRDYMCSQPLHPEDRALLPDRGALLLVEFGGEDRRAAEAKAEAVMRRLPGSVRARMLEPGDQTRRMWALRESGLGATARTAAGARTWPGWEDSAVPPAQLGRYLRGLRKLLQKHGYEGAFYGHFGDGCVHLRVDFDLRSQAGVQQFRMFMGEAADLVVAHGGSLSGEHGDGHARAELLPRMFGEELIAGFRQFKAIWDPAGRMNPGKVVDAFGMDEHLRWGPGWQPAAVQTYFSYPEDGGSFAQALTRCVGVGTCRRTGSGLMCPSFMATGDERHSTRGRAHLLQEMLQGEVLPGGFQEEAVREALDLCLSCKGCRRDCPAGVDMATYKAEFMAQYYRQHRRPSVARGLGQIERWSRLAGRMPGLAHWLSSQPALAALLKSKLQLAPQRPLPVFAAEPFTDWFRKRPRRNRGGSRVLLWPDTFTNFFQPEIGQAAVFVLEQAGFDPILPRRPLCCGRPLFDHGYLDQARRQLRQAVDTLRPMTEQGIPIVGLEPGCLSVFRDEMPNLLGSEEAKQLGRQCRLFSEFLEEAGFQPPRLEGEAIVHLHCHHRAVLGTTAEEKLLRATGLDWKIPEEGCCGMAGAFGFEAKNFELSQRLAERRLLPALRSCSRETLLIANGFSCREQMRGAAGTRPLHMAEVLEIALRRRCG